MAIINFETWVKENNLTTAVKQKLTKLLNEGMSILKISKKLCRDYQMIKKAVEAITKLRTQSKEKVLRTSSR